MPFLLRFLVVPLVATLVFFPVAAKAESLQDMNSLVVAVNVQENGSLQVEETLDFSTYNYTDSRAWVINASTVQGLQLFNGDAAFTGFSVKQESLRAVVSWSASGANSAIWKLKYTVPNWVKPAEKTDGFSWMLFSGDQNTYIAQVSAVVKFPSAAGLSKYEQYVFAAHGLNNGKAVITDDQTLTCTGAAAQPSSNFTIVTTFDKGVIKYSSGVALKTFLTYLPWYIWIIVGILLPILTFVVMSIIKVLRKGRDLFLGKVETESVEPPSALTPAQVGVLYRQKVAAVDIAATLVNLASRGYLQIVERTDTFILGKRKSFDDLVGFEKLLMEEMFEGKNNISSTDIELKRKQGGSLYSKRVKKIYEQLYAQAKEAGYFADDPANVRIKFFAYGLLLFLLGIIAFIVQLSVFSYVLYMPFAILGISLSGIVVINQSRKVPTMRTAAGRAEVKKWLAYQAHLTHFLPTTVAEILQQKFMVNLPYAMAMGMGERWAKTFADQAFYLPNWYIVDKPSRSTEDFYAKILKAGTTIAQSTDPSLR